MAKRIIKATMTDKNTTIEEEQKRKQRVCAYCRVSSKSDEQLNSMESQVEYFTNRISNNPEWEFANIYEDRGISGTSLKNREGMNNLLQDAKAGLFDIVLCKSISRFGRNALDTITNVNFLKKNDIRVVFETDNLDTGDTGNELLLNIFATLAENFSYELSKSVRWGNTEEFKRGHSIYGNNNLLGYRRSKKMLKNDEGIEVLQDWLKIVPEEAKTVKLIFQMYLDGYGSPKIANYLKENGHKTALGKVNWSPTSILLILKNEKYCGTLLTQKYITTDLKKDHKRKKNKRIEDQVEHTDRIAKIVDVETFEKVQEEIKKRRKMQNSETGVNTKHSNRYPLSGKLKCGNCGAGFRRDVWHPKSKNPTTVWQCFTYATKKKENCDVGSIKENVIFEAIALILKDLKNDSVFNNAFNIVVSTLESNLQENSIEKDIRKIKKEADEIEEDMGEATIRQIKGIFTEKAYNIAYAQLEEQYNNKLSLINKLKEKQKEAQNKNEKIENIKKLLKANFKESISEEDYIKTMVKTIIIYSKQKFSIVLDTGIMDKNYNFMLNDDKTLEYIQCDLEGLKAVKK